MSTLALENSNFTQLPETPSPMTSAVLPATNVVPRNWSRTVASDLALVACVAAGTGAVFIAQGALQAGSPAFVPAYAIILSLLMFAYRPSLDAFAARSSWLKVSLLGATAAPLALALPNGAQESLFTMGTLVALVGLAAIAAAVPAVVFRCMTALLALPTIKARFCRRVAIFGATEESVAVHESLEKSAQGYAFAGLFDDRRGNSRIANTVTPMCGTLDTLVRLVRSGRIDEVIICLPRRAARRTREIAELMRGYPVNVHVVTHFVENETLALSPGNSVKLIGKAALAQVHTKPIRGWGLACKETMDRLGAAVLLAGLSPVFALIAAAIKLDSKGPVFFRQRRHGLMGRTITVWKFRTMTCTEDGPTVRQAQKNDTRVTKVGRFLRKTSLDELPQLINVLFGEMSLVGPRPHAIAHNEHYGALIKRYDHRNQVKPGITGWAQVNGLRGETSTPRHMELRVAHDLAYIGNWSIWFDIKVLFLTPIYGFVNRNAY